MFEDDASAEVAAQSFVADADAGAAAPAARSPAELLGLIDPELDDLKESAQDLFKRATASKRPKLTHATFFDNEKGLKRIVKTFPKIRFQGKGREFEDLKLLLRSYSRWFEELHPYNEQFEDLVNNARRILHEKERTDDGLWSDPRERLHLFRFEYKNAPPVQPDSPASAKKEVSDDLKRRVEENRKRALKLREEKLAAAKQTETGASGDDAEVDMLARIEEKRQRALAIKAQRLAEEAELAEAAALEAAAAEAAAAPAAGQSRRPVSSLDDDEDVFGFGFDMDDEVPTAAAPAAKPMAAPAPAADEEEDIFGHGGGMDEEPEPAAQAPRAPPAFEEPPDEMDVFGFGGGLDEP